MSETEECCSTMVELQSNGIIRNGDGLIIGRLDVSGFKPTNDNTDMTTIKIPHHLYTKFGGRANMIHFLEHGKEELIKCKTKLDLVTEALQLFLDYVDGIAYNEESGYHYSEYDVYKFAKEILKEMEEI